MRPSIATASSQGHEAIVIAGLEVEIFVVVVVGVEKCRGNL